MTQQEFDALTPGQHVALLADAPLVVRVVGRVRCSRTAYDTVVGGGYQRIAWLPEIWTADKCDVELAMHRLSEGQP